MLPVEMPVELSGPLVDGAPEGSPPEESPGVDTGCTPVSVGPSVEPPGDGFSAEPVSVLVAVPILTPQIGSHAGVTRSKADGHTSGSNSDLADSVVRPGTRHYVTHQSVAYAMTNEKGREADRSITWVASRISMLQLPYHGKCFLFRPQCVSNLSPNSSAVWHAAEFLVFFPVPDDSPSSASVPEATTPRTKLAAGAHSCIFHTPPFDHGDGMEGAGRTTNFGEIIHKAFPRSISEKPDDDKIRRLMDAETEAKQGPREMQFCRTSSDSGHQTIDPTVDVIMVKSNVSPGLLDPKSLLGTGGILFGNMLGWGAQEAVNIYNDNKRTLVKERIIEAAQVLDGEAEWFVSDTWSGANHSHLARLLRSLNATASLGALERPIGLPPSLLKKAEEVRLEQGPERIEAYLDDVQRLARHAIAILDEAMNILDSKTSENEAARKGELVGKNGVGVFFWKAAQSDVTMREKREESEAAIVNLTLDEEELEAWVPSTTIISAAAIAPSAEAKKKLIHTALWLWIHLLQANVSNQTYSPHEDVIYGGLCYLAG
ncbi:hypothetical protein EDD15DRAFT_2196014 [Pisolithus albus]|nr:hypothetical protein EDD15DRAFT_2196014 [Pisolithus albus]